MKFPNKEREDMPDRIWETYCCLVWCGNSLNATAGRLHHTDPQAAKYLERAQEVITHLLEDSGRLEELREWEKNNIT